VFEPTGSRRDAASVIFNLPGYRVIDADDLPLGGRRVKVQPVDLADGCPICGVVSSRVHAWTEQRVRDIPHAGDIEVVVRKTRMVCAEPACPRRTFTPSTEQLPARARCTTRLKTALLDAVIDSGRAVAEVAGDHGVAWWTVQATVNAAAVLLPNIDELYVRRLGIDEHRYRRVRWFRNETGGWRRVEPWMSTIVNADCGQVLGIVDGRDSASVAAWLATRSQAWRDRIEVVAIDPSAPFKKAIRDDGGRRNNGPRVGSRLRLDRHRHSAGRRQSRASAVPGHAIRRCSRHSRQTQPRTHTAFVQQTGRQAKPGETSPIPASAPQSAPPFQKALDFGSRDERSMVIKRLWPNCSMLGTKSMLGGEPRLATTPAP
jgi:hypothetical protein